MQKESSRKRPFGLVIIILLQLIIAIWLIADIYFAPPTILIAQLLENIQVEVPPVAGLLVLGYQLIVITGLWLLRRWAWLLLMMQLGLGMVFQLILYFNGHPLYIYMLISVITVLYLNQREVQSAFERRNQSRSAA